MEKQIQVISSKIIFKKILLIKIQVQPLKKSITKLVFINVWNAGFKEKPTILQAAIDPDSPQSGYPQQESGIEEGTFTS